MFIKFWNNLEKTLTFFLWTVYLSKSVFDDWDLDLISKSYWGGFYILVHLQSYEIFPGGFWWLIHIFEFNAKLSGFGIKHNAMLWRFRLAKINKESFQSFFFLWKQFRRDLRTVKSFHFQLRSNSIKKIKGFKEFFDVEGVNNAK